MGDRIPKSGDVWKRKCDGKSAEVVFVSYPDEENQHILYRIDRNTVSRIDSFVNNFEFVKSKE